MFHPADSTLPPAELAVDAQATDAAIREDVEAQERHWSNRADLILVKMSRVRLQLRARQNPLPLKLREIRFARRRLVNAAGFERTAFGEIAFEVRRVNFDASHRARRAELNDGPIMARPATTLRLPTIRHIERASRHNQVMAMPEEHIAT